MTAFTTLHRLPRVTLEVLKNYWWLLVAPSSHFGRCTLSTRRRTSKSCSISIKSGSSIQTMSYNWRTFLTLANFRARTYNGLMSYWNCKIFLTARRQTQSTWGLGCITRLHVRRSNAIIIWFPKWTSTTIACYFCREGRPAKTLKKGILSWRLISWSKCRNSR